MLLEFGRYSILWDGINPSKTMRICILGLAARYSSKECSFFWAGTSHGATTCRLYDGCDSLVREFGMEGSLKAMPRNMSYCAATSCLGLSQTSRQSGRFFANEVKDNKAQKIECIRRCTCRFKCGSRSCCDLCRLSFLPNSSFRVQFPCLDLGLLISYIIWYSDTPVPKLP